MMRLMAPILSFTSNEIWQTLAVDADKTVFEDVWYTLPDHHLNEEDMLAWEDILHVRALVNKAIEEKRAAGLVGSSLQSEIDIYADDKVYESLEKLQDDLRFVLISSRATLHRESGTGLRIVVTPSAHAKCERCWHYRADVGADELHPQICGRCVRNLFGTGEYRTHA
jgi:isoleucyl-tRNA synthetase